MCLVKSIIHKKDYSKRFIAEKDIIVYKALDHCDTFGNKCICTPYMYYPIVFVNGKCIISSVLTTSDSPYVSVGVHAFRTEERIKRTCDFFPETKMTKHWAIIPKGSKYYIGQEEDIVTNKLIVFKTREEFRKYRKEHKCTK